MTTMRTCQQLLKEFPYRQLQFANTKLPIRLKGKDKRDVYNISSPFFYNGRELLLGRAEFRDSEDSSIIFLRRNAGIWTLDEQYQPLDHLQDPFFCMIGGKMIIGGVEVYRNQVSTLTYRTVFYRETAPFQLQRFACGPEHMKDIRLLELPNGKILITTRPQGAEAGRGKIGFTVIRSLDDLNDRSISSARIFEDQFAKEEWGGTNQLHLLKNGKIGVLSHIANFDPEGNRHYYSTCFLLDPESGSHSPMKIIAVRKNFENGPSKRNDLKDVVFAGGLVRQKNGTAVLYCGVGDTEAHCITILDPFLKWEKI
ncbi:hypothetical protein CAFE_08380 [Caprobacter fermentans]|uniref:DUF1861 family protein n=1 Tax=Caproicibacter fermentans TaxID=2576756 RepID=A0A6N8HXC6_9FIRM|nr:DUF1861 family protein [Caproicibacter fermentans]MVB10160.1 hypothetical protein [Caproicibacter fermentans]OCN00807.1 hypothetical protein A7X67_08540 [Clostridium sp. W14A]QNK41752.1 DUF1861 family protein [Caproicibacter fermentans]